MLKSVLFALVTINIVQCGKLFDDTVLFNLQWPGLGADIDRIGESMFITTSHNEKYQCFLPSIDEKEEVSSEKYEGPSALTLISPLFNKKVPCSYRLESYWTYELCHGRYIRQFHENREGKTLKLQEYILGQWDDTLKEQILLEIKDDKRQEETVIPPTKKIDGNNLPYYELVMDNGTLCELNENKPRVTSVLYVCYIFGKNEIYSIKEISTCQYEIIVLSASLCNHPKYKSNDVGENKINCLPVENSPNKPYSLLKMKAESRKLRRGGDLDHIRLEFLPVEVSENSDEAQVATDAPIDTAPVESFLAGKTCLNGGTGWWKYEFCYGKSVEQYHIDKDSRKITIRLGNFHREKHVEWVLNNPHKKPKPVAVRKQVSHFYSGGDICDKTGLPRQTEVKLKCLENASSFNIVSLYLLEPKPCEYVLGVESPLICKILPRADDLGLVEEEELPEEIVEIRL